MTIPLGLHQLTPETVMPFVSLPMSLAKTRHMAPINHKKAGEGSLMCAQKEQGGSAAYP